MKYLLDTCSTVDEVLAAQEEVRNLTVDHYLVVDRSGDAVTIEFLDGELVAHTGGDLPLSGLTNSPYDEVLGRWQTHGGSGDYGWMDGSSQRFCIAADRVSDFEGGSAEEGVNYTFQTLQASNTGLVDLAAGDYSEVSVMAEGWRGATLESCVMASANREIPVRHRCRRRNRIADFFLQVQLIVYVAADQIVFHMSPVFIIFLILTRAR